MWATELAPLHWGMKCHSTRSFSPYFGNPTSYWTQTEGTQGGREPAFPLSQPHPPAPDTKRQSKPFSSNASHFSSPFSLPGALTSINLMKAIFFLFCSSPPATPNDKTWKQHDL